MQDPGSVLDVIEAAIFAGFAAIGGVLGYAMRAGNNKESITWVKMLVEGCASAFVGLLAMMACNALGLQWQWAGVICGVLGWLGAESSISILAKLVRSKLGIDNDKRD